MSDRITLEELTADEALLGPWYSGDPPVADARVAHPRDAAAHCIMVALNAADGAKGVIRILAPGAEQKRLIRCFLEAMLEQPKLKAMVRRLTPETIFLHGGLRVVIDTNEARLTRDVVATIALDTSVGEPVGSVWLEVDGDVIEDKEAAAVRHGFKVEDAPHLRFIRWMTTSEAAAATPILHPLDAHDEPGPPADGPADTNRVVNADQLLEEKLAKRQAEIEAEAKYHAAVEEERRRAVNEKLAEATRQFGRSIA